MKAFTTQLVSIARAAGVAAGLLVLVAGGAGAQQTAGSWQPWLACWSAGPTVGGVPASSLAPVVATTWWRRSAWSRAAICR